MAKVTGIGGIFFKAEDPKQLYAWYETHLGIKRRQEEAVMFSWREMEHPDRTGMTVWSIFPRNTKYFDPGRADFMMNYRVDDIDGLLAQLREAGVEIERHEDTPYGRFAWIMDPEGNRIELWEPPQETAVPSP